MKKIAFVCLILLPIALFAITLEVSLDNTTFFSRIQNAVSIATNGDTILVHPGVYYENISLEGKHGITLVSSGDEFDTVIDGSNGNRGCIGLLSGEENIIISGFEIRNGSIPADYSLPSGGIMMSDADNITLQNLVIHHNYSTIGGGLCITDSEFIALSNVVVRDNTAILRGGGVYQSDNTNIQYDMMNRCSIYDNYSVLGMDIYSRDVCNLYLDTFSYPYYGENNAYVQYYNNDANGLSEIFIQSPLYQYVTSSLYLSPDGDDANDGLTPETALRTPWVAFSKLPVQVSSNRTVYFAPGIYNNTRNGIGVGLHVPAGLTIQGAGKEETVISIDNSYYRGYGMYVKPDAYRVEINDLTIKQTNGSALYCSGAEEVIVSNVSFEDCQHAFYSFISIVGEDTHVTFDNVTFQNTVNNQDGGELLWIVGSEVSLTNCQFKNNVMDISQAWANYMINISDCDSVLVKDCLFMNNDTYYEYGAMQIEGSSIVWDNNLYTNNITHTTGNLYFRGSDVYVLNSTFSMNTSCTSDHNFLDLIGHNKLRVINCISDNNTQIDEIDCSSDDLLIDYCTFTRQFALYGIDPADIGNNVYTQVALDLNGGDPADMDFYLYNVSNLTDPSITIDNGTTDLSYFYPGYMFPTYDAVGNPRIYNGTIDIGALEFCPAMEEDDNSLAVTGNLLQGNFPNPFNPTTTIKFSLAKQAQADISIYNIKGQRVRTLTDRSYQQGKHAIIWDGKDDKGNSLSSGIYFYKLRVDNLDISTRRCVLMK